MSAVGGHRCDTAPNGIHHDPAACIGIHPAALLNAMAVEAGRWPDIATIAQARIAKRRRDTAEMLDLRAQGWKVAAIARRFDTTDAAMSQRLSRARKHHPDNVGDRNSVGHGRIVTA